MRILAMLLLALSAQMARADGDALSWLQRIHVATQKLSYTGTFVYRSGDRPKPRASSILRAGTGRANGWRRWTVIRAKSCAAATKCNATCRTA